MVRKGDEKITRKTLGREGLDWLLQSTFLARLNHEELEDCLGRMVWRYYDRGEHLTHIGQVSDGVDLVVSGQAAVMALDVEGRMSTFAHAAPGSLVGERSLVFGESHQADVVAASRMRTLFLAQAEFMALYNSVERFRAYVDGLVAVRERWPVLVSLLSQNPFLRSLGKEDVERLLQNGQLVSVKREELLLQAGKQGTEVYIVIKGKVGVFSPPEEDGRRQRIAVAEPGELVGHAAVLLELPRSADIVALDEGELLRVEATAFMDIVTRNPLVQRQLLQYLAMLDLPTAPEIEEQMQRPVIFVGSAERGLGATTVAYGMAGAMPDVENLVVVDLDGPETAQRLGYQVRKQQLAGCSVYSMAVPERWKFRVVWPRGETGPGKLVEALRNQRGVQANAPVLVAGHSNTEEGDEALARSEALVFLRRASDALCDMPTTRGQVRYQAIRVEKDEPLPLATSRKAARLPMDLRAAETFWRTGDLLPISSKATPLGRACNRLVRLVRGRSVGVALGGGGALGFAHIGLLRVLEGAGIDVDYVAGVSFGSLAGAIYVGGGLPALEEMIRKRLLLTGYVGLALGTTRVFDWFVQQVVGPQHLGMTEIPFYPVGLDLSTGKEFVLSRGTLGKSVRSSSCMPGAFPALRVGTARLVDGGMVNNVPASVIWEAGGDFIIGSNIIPPNPEGSRPPLGTVPFAGRLLGGLARLDDTVRSLYMFASQAGRDRSLMADYIFDLSLEGYNLYDFWSGDAIAEAGQKQAERQLPAILKAHAEDKSIRF